MNLKNAIKIFSFYYSYLRALIFVFFIFTVFISLLDIFGIIFFLPLIEGFESNQIIQTKDSFIFIIKNVLYESVNIFSNFFQIDNLTVASLIVILLIFLVKGIANIFLNGVNAIIRGFLFENIKRDLIYLTHYKAYNRDVSNDGIAMNIIIDHATKSVQFFYNFSQFFTKLLFFFMYYGAAIFFSKTLGIASLFIGVLFYFLFKKFNGIVVGSSDSLANLNNDFSKKLLNYLKQRKYLIITGNHTVISGVVLGVLNNLKQLQTKLWFLSSFTKSIQEPLSVLILITILIFDISINKTPISILLVSSILIYKGANSLMVMQSALQNTLELYGSINSVISFKELNSKLKKLKKLKKNKKIRQVRNIKLSSVSFLVNNKKIIDNFSFNFEIGNIYSIVGESGSGKSSVLNLLNTWNYPTKGNIEINDIDFHNIDKSFFYNNLSYMPSNNDLLSTDLIFNLTLKEKLTSNQDKKIKKYLDIFSLDKLYKNYNVKNNNLSNLSTGEIQRLSVIRELIKDSQIVLLDEPSSAMDYLNEKKLLSILKKNKDNKIIIIATHSPLLTKSSDRIIQMHKGKISNISNPGKN